ncbi:hypothetical protein ACJIZ3_011030 [Penstemon smallii]|uniref:Uncharacterized protein n=1 Tax=Penstemon smallii TaxID=265156 RepID=A0ABD3UL61_9LAMI
MEPQSITAKLAQLSVAQQECTIYRVHSHLRNVNDKAYEPEIISIGPYHCGKENLKMFEEHKLRYLHLLLQSKKKNVQDFISIIGREEQKARKCYAEPISLNATEFTEMMVLDGIFIIELVRKYNGVILREKNDPIFHMYWIMNSLQRDLMLFENQIPFFILLKLFDLVEVPGQHNKLMTLFSCFFGNLYPAKVNRKRSKRRPESPDKIKHLLDLVHCDWFPSFEDTKDVTERSWRSINSATGLIKANVKFKRNEGVTTLFDVGFEKGTMLLARITITDKTESVLRNLIVFEQYFQDTRSSFVTDYVTFLDYLINSSRDVEILSRFEIIDNWLGDDEVVANLFNKLGDSVTFRSSRFIYNVIFEDVDIHCRRRRNRWMAKLRSNYLNSPWAIVSVIVAFIIVILTIIQTVSSILQVVKCLHI